MYLLFLGARDTVAKKSENDEENREGHALVDSTLRLDAVVHHHVPVLARQDLTDRQTRQTSSERGSHIVHKAYKI